MSGKSQLKKALEMMADTAGFLPLDCGRAKRTVFLLQDAAPPCCQVKADGKGQGAPHSRQGKPCGVL